MREDEKNEHEEKRDELLGDKKDELIESSDINTPEGIQRRETAIKQVEEAVKKAGSFILVSVAPGEKNGVMSQVVSLVTATPAGPSFEACVIVRAFKEWMEKYRTECRHHTKNRSDKREEGGSNE